MTLTRCKTRSRSTFALAAALSCLVLMATAASAHKDTAVANGSAVSHAVSAFSDPTCETPISEVSECAATIYYQATVENSLGTNGYSFEGGSWHMTTPDGVIHDLAALLPGGVVPCVAAPASTDDPNSAANGGRGLCAGKPGFVHSACVPYTVDTGDLVGGLWTASATYVGWYDHADTDDNLNASAGVTNSADISEDPCDGVSQTECTGNEQCVNHQCVSPPLNGTACTDTDGNECTVAQCVTGVCQQSVAGNEGGACDDFNGQFDAECASPACESGTCVLNPDPNTKACDPGGTFDEECADPHCDGAGSCELNPADDGTPCSSDSDECTDDICLDATCEHPPADPLPQECVGDFTCRTCGFWGNHPNIVQELLDTHLISVCGGEVMDTTDAEDSSSANEAICVKVKGKQFRQLARQLTCLSLNCAFSGPQEALVEQGVATVNICTGQSAGGQNLGDLFAICDAACATAAAGGSNAGVGACVDAIDCVNNGGTPGQVDGHFVCNQVAPNCHQRDVFCPDGDPICFPQESAQPGDCKASRSSSCTYADQGDDSCN